MKEYSDIPFNKVYNFWIDDIDVGKGILVCENSDYYILHNSPTKTGGKPRKKYSGYLYGWYINSIHKVEYQEISEINLVGRYLKAKVDNPWSIMDCKKGDYLVIINSTQCYKIKDFSKSKWIFANRSTNFLPHENFELMPEGFVPNDSSEPKNSIPEYIKCISEIYGLEVGKIYPCNKGGIVMDGKYNNYCYSYNEFKPSTKEAYYNQLLEEAKRKFPIGCKYKPITTSGQLSSDIVIQKRECYLYDSFGKIWIIGNYNIMNPDGKWAELVEMPEESKTEPENISFYVIYSPEFTEDLYNKLNNWCKSNSKGMIRGFADSYKGFKEKKYYIFNNWGLRSTEYDSKYIENQFTYGVDNNSQECKHEYSIKQIKDLINYKEPEINTYGLKVGDFLSEDVISKWASKTNHYYSCMDRIWKPFATYYYENRKIEGFEVLNGIVGFKVSNSSTYLKAEGFKEFMDNFNKSENYWIPKVGEYAVMVNAEGWSYSYENNGYVALITEVSKRDVGYSKPFIVYAISGDVINPKSGIYTRFKNVPIIDSKEKVVCRKALPHEIPNIEFLPDSDESNEEKCLVDIKLDIKDVVDYFKQHPLTPKECYPVDVLDKYQQKPVIYSGKKVKSKIVTIFN